jgi:hypothetical protein
MIFLKELAMQGQSFLEAIIGAGLMMILGVIATVILLKGFGTLVATRWAASHSRCLAKEVETLICENQTKHSLEKDFAFHHVLVRARILRGIIHSSIDGELAGFAHVHGQYDLTPTEYLRDSK